MSSKLCAAALLALALGAFASAGDARPNRRPAALPRIPISHQVAFMGYLRDGRVVTVYTDARAVIAPPRSTTPAAKRGRMLRQATATRPQQRWLPTSRYGPLEGDVSPAVRRRILFDLDHPPQRFVPERVIVAFAPSVTMPRDSDALSPSAAASLRQAVLTRRRDVSPHAFTNDVRTNLALTALGVDRADRLFAHLDRASLSSMRARAEARTRRPLLAFDNAFVLHVGAASVDVAVKRLRALPGVAYAAPDHAVAPMIAERRPVGEDVLREMASYHRSPRTFGRAVRTSTSLATVPSNTAVAFNLQAMLNAPGVDAIAAFDEIGARYNQLPGTGEIITNVGLGDATDASAAADPNDPCHDAVASGGPTTRIAGGQRYLDLPSLPLIPVWVSDANATLSPAGEVCDVDPQLGEVGLDFSVMAPLPDALQRPGASAAFTRDLLGIAPGASYRWVAPGRTRGVIGTSDTLAAMIGASRQSPAPNVITASIGFGVDSFGFPSRYLEDDPLAQSVVAGIVASNVVVCIAANDGTRMVTMAAVGPSGGSAATNVGTSGSTSIADLAFTTAPSVVPDSGAIDVGATTLDDIFSANPQDPALAALANVKAFPETRYNGGLNFSSGFGTRVNVSAPGDNIEALFRSGPAYNDVGLENVGGTSASAPEVAAAAAIALQVARLTGHPLTSAAQVRDLLVATGTPVANPPQSDVPLNVGPQVSVRRIVEQLLANAGHPVQPGIARVAVQGRRTGAFIAAFNTHAVNDAAFFTALDPAYIKLDGPFTRPVVAHIVSFPGSDTGAELNSYVTIAPDWEGIPANASYRLTVAGQPARVIATTPYVRMLPAQLFAAAGVPLTPGVSRTLALTYTASVGLHSIAQSTFQLTFGPPAPSSRLLLAPKVPPVVSGSTIPVSYDLRGYPSAALAAPVLNVSFPGMGSNFFQGLGIYPVYSVPLPATNGTVNVPVAALDGAGTYTVWIDLQPGLTAFNSDSSDLAFTRVDSGTARPDAPLLSLPHDTSPPTRTLEVPFKSPFVVSYDVSHVPGASGAIIELAAPPPAPFFYNIGLEIGFNTFRNPNGNTLDADGVITGSLYHVRATGTSGSVTIDPVAANIPATTTVNVRVLPANGTGPIAEAGDAGTVQYDGIKSAFGLLLSAVFMNPHGTDGYLSENGAFGNANSNVQLLTFEPFDLGSAAISGVPFSFTSSNMSVTPIVQDDVAVVGTSVDLTNMEYYRAAPLNSAFTRFYFPPGSLPTNSYLYVAAANSSATRSAYLAQDLMTGNLSVTRGDVVAGTDFAPGIDLTNVLGPNFDFTAFVTFAYDPSLDRAYMILEDSTLTCEQQSPQLVTIDFTTGTATARVLPIDGADSGGFGYQMAIDPTTHIAAIATSCQTDSFTKSRAELTLLDLSTGTVRPVFKHVLGSETLFHGFLELLGGDAVEVGIDPVNHLVLQRSMFCPTVVGNFDLNARVCLNEYDETGRLAKTIPGLFSDGFSQGFFNGANGTTRTGVAMGQEASGSSYIYSTDVQPYSY